MFAFAKQLHVLKQCVPFPFCKTSAWKGYVIFWINNLNKASVNDYR
jgi:hypothetical protein